MRILTVFAANIGICAVATAVAATAGIWPAAGLALALYVLLGLACSLARFKRDCERDGVHPPEGWTR